MPTGEPAGSTVNVGLFARAIKGKLLGQSAIARKATQSGNKRGYFLNSSSAALYRSAVGWLRVARSSRIEAANARYSSTTWASE